MNPSDGRHDWFDWTATLILPTVGILVALAGTMVAIVLPLIVLYVQRHADTRRAGERRVLEDQRINDERTRADRLLREQREQAEADRVREARKRGSRDAVAMLAPFIGLDPFREDVRPLLVNMRVALMALVDEYPADHALNDLVSFQHHLGMAISKAILEAGEPVPKPSVSVPTAARQKAELINPLHGWAAHFTSDLRIIQADGATDQQIVSRTKHARQALANVFEQNGWGDPPEQTLRRRPSEGDES